MFVQTYRASLYQARTRDGYATFKRLEYLLRETVSGLCGDLEAMQSYLTNVPPSYHRYTRPLSICASSVADLPTGTAPFDRALVSGQCVQILSQCPQLEQLTLHLGGALDDAVIPCFANLHALRVLSVNHCGDEQQSPL